MNTKQIVLTVLVTVSFVLAFLLIALPSVTAESSPQTVVGIEFLDMETFSTGTSFNGTEVGGLSAITYDPNKDVYYVLSDQRSDALYFTVDIDIPDGELEIAFEDINFLMDQRNKEFLAGYLDPEGIHLAREGQLFISSEGDADASPPIDPFVNRFTKGGKQNRALIVPDKFLPDGNLTFGIRDNLAFESLTSDRSNLYTATENALYQDGPASTLTDYSPSRLLEYALSNKRPGSEFVYLVNPIPKAPVPAGSYADNGLVELQAIDNYGTFIAMERSYAVGVGNTVVLYETSKEGATDVSGIVALDTTPVPVYTPMSKSFLADFEDDLGIVPDNLEGMTFGPTLPDGRQLLIVVSDNNFNPTQTTQFIALAVELEPVE